MTRTRLGFSHIDIAPVFFCKAILRPATAALTGTPEPEGAASILTEIPFFALGRFSAAIYTRAT
jgi:hypothetical protein